MLKRQGKTLMDERIDIICKDYNLEEKDVWECAEARHPHDQA